MRLDKDIKSISILYEKGNSLSSIAEKYQVNKSTIGRLLHKHGVRVRTNGEVHRKYFFNESFFDIIDTEEKAYFLGLLYADGSNSIKNGNTVSLSLQEGDIDILIKFKEVLEYTKPIVFIDRKKKNLNWSNSANLTIDSKYLSDKLAEWGCVSPKSLTLEFPRWIAPRLLRHFIRGYVDGDGSLCILAEECGRLEIAGTLDFCSQVNILIKEYLQLEGQIRPLKRIFIWYVNGHNAIKVLDWLYDNSKVSLNRKFNKYLEMKEFYWSKIRVLEHLGKDELLALHTVLGSWSCVATHLEVSTNVIRRARIKSGLSVGGLGSNQYGSLVE